MLEEKNTLSKLDNSLKNIRGYLWPEFIWGKIKSIRSKIYWRKFLGWQPKSTRDIKRKKHNKKNCIWIWKSKSNLQRLKRVYCILRKRIWWRTLFWTKKIFKRIEFNQVSKNTVLESLKNPRDIDYNLVNAALARRYLDRFFGYKISPITQRRTKFGTVVSIYLIKSLFGIELPKSSTFQPSHLKKSAVIYKPITCVSSSIADIEIFIPFGVGILKLFLTLSISNRQNWVALCSSVISILPWCHKFPMWFNVDLIKSR